MECPKLTFQTGRYVLSWWIAKTIILPPVMCLFSPFGPKRLLVGAKFYQ